VSARDLKEVAASHAPAKRPPAAAPAEAPAVRAQLTSDVRFVVGLGASAGGLEALERFFDKAPTDSGGAFVVVMHLARNFRSMLDELLSRHTTMKVRAVADGMELEPDTVYVIQPGTEIEVLGAALRVTMRPTAAMSGRLSSIDALLRSIAHSWGERGVGVILSGSGTDGSQGVVALHAAGGTSLVQAPESAKFDSMPVAAIATHCVSAVDAPETLAKLACESAALRRLAKSAALACVDSTALQSILASVVGANHLDASQYAQSTFERRVFRRMRERECGTLSEYAEIVRDDRLEARALAEALLIGVTDFFRDEGAFASVARLVMPELVRRAEEEARQIRVWVPGCATGEEAYSLAMLVAEATADHPTPVDFQIFATDIHKGSLAEAARGEFSDERMVNVSEARRREFFTQNASGKWQISPRLRRYVVFAPHDVLADPPFTRLDLISCRNLLIYFSVEAQQRVLSNFAFGLGENGYLFLGSSETVGAQREAFDFVDVRRRLFRRTRARSRAAFKVRGLDSFERAATIVPLGGGRRSLKLRETFLQPVYAALLKEFAPAALLVSSDRELLHSFGDARRFLRAPEGVMRFDVADMCDPALKTRVTVGIERALRERVEQRISRVELSAFPEPGMIVDVTIRPLQVEDSSPFALLLLSAPPNPAHGSPAPAAPLASDARSADLELEIMRTREALQATIEEIETTNEQLKAANEELLSSNEELQSTNEELNSLNEELHSVNAEHFRQNTELVKLTRDFDALLRVSEIGVLFLDEGYAIRRFTRLIGELFQLTDADIERPIHTFRNPFPEFDLEAMLGRVMRHGLPQEANVQDGALRGWLLRVARYPDQKGIVLSVVSLGGIRPADHTLSHENARLLADAAPYAGDALFVVDPEDGRILFANGRAQMMYGVPEAPPDTLEISRLTPEWSTQTWVGWLGSINVGASGLRADVTVIDRKGKLATVDLRAASVRDGDRTSALVRLLENTHRHDNAAALRELRDRVHNLAVSNRELERFASVVAHDLRAPLRHLSQFSDFLAADLGLKATPTATEHLGVIKTSATRMSQMVERLLEYARIGVGAPKLGLVDLAACFAEACEILGTDAGAADIKAKFGAYGFVRGDRILVTRLFQNLLQNALKFHKPDAAATVRVSADGDADTVKLTFEDEGLGVNPAQADRIFEMFGRGEEAEGVGGYGIGLAVSRRICESLGGSITIDLAKTEGTRFIVTLARGRARRKPAPRP
jgi:two-component system CheB/CheR fusion protein